MEENPLEKDFKELQKATKRVFTRYDESKEEDRERAKKLLENLKSEKGNEVLIKCIKACKENSLRLRSDSQKKRFLSPNIAPLLKYAHRLE